MTQKRIDLRPAPKKAKKKSVNPESKKGHLVIIGGAEDKEGDKLILKEIAKMNEGGKMVVITAASEIPHVLWETYNNLFYGMGIRKIEHLGVHQQEDARDPKHLEILKDAKTVFFTGGDQLKITSKIGGTAIEAFVIDLYQRGGIIAGTSAGASVMGQIMLVGGENSESHKVGNWMMAPGLGMAQGMIIDQHFAQRGRIGRLLGAVALNPGILGIGIDEDTAIIIEDNNFKVIGRNAVYIVDGHGVSYTNISEASAEQTMSMHDVKLHILAHEEIFDFKSRKAFCPGQVSGS